MSEAPTLDLRSSAPAGGAIARIENGLIAVLFSLLPIGVHQHAESSAVVWGTSSAIFGVLGSLHAFVIQGRRRVRLRAELGA